MLHNICALVLATGPLLLAQAKNVKLRSPNTLSKPNGYSHIAEVTGGKMIFIAGQVALDKDGQLAGKDDFAAQVRQVFTNLGAALKAAGASYNDLVKLNYYVADRVDRSQITTVREIRNQFLNAGAPPVSTFVYVKELVRPEWMIEIEAVAVVNK